MITKIGEIECYKISEETAGLTNKQKMEMAEKMFKEKYQGKLLSYKMLEKELFVKVNRMTRGNFSSHMKKEGISNHKVKVAIAADGKYIDLISNPNYSKSMSERKTGKSKHHKEKQMYHYFLKDVIIDDSLYSVIINVMEKENHMFYVYYVEIKKVGFATSPINICL